MKFIVKSIFDKNKNIYFYKSNVLRPTKNIIRKTFFSWIFLISKDLYILDLFSGSCIFSIDFYFLKFKKILNFDINIFNFLFILRSLNKCVYKNLFFIKISSIIWLNFLDILNFSLVIIDPPYNLYKQKKFFLEFNNLSFLRGCVLLFFEFKYFKYFNNFFDHYFLLKKCVIGHIIFILIKKI